MGNYKWFTDAEVQGLDKELCAMLDMAREYAGVPIVITCGLRSPQQNACLHGAVADSAHLKGMAVDIATGDDHVKNRIMEGLIKAGLGSRCGEYYKNNANIAGKLDHHHIHIDIDSTLPQQMTWALIEQN